MEALEEEEADDLLSFAQNLNIDEYLDDYEVRAALEAVQARVQSMKMETERKERAERAEREREREEGEEYEGKYDNEVPRFSVPEPEDMDDEQNLTLGMGGGAAKFREFPKKNKGMGKLTKDTLAALSNHGGDIDEQKDFETRSVRSAQSVLSDVKSLRGIHSARSLAALAKQTAREMGMGEGGNGRMPTIQESKKNYAPPKIVIVDDTKGLRDEIKKQPGQLPYMHRNPAV